MSLHILREDPFFSSALPFDSFFDDEHWDLFTLFRDNLQNHRKRAKQRGVDQPKKQDNKEGAGTAAPTDDTKKAATVSEMLFQNPLGMAMMASDLIETDKSFVIYLDLPGVKVEDLDVTIQEATGSGGGQHNILTIAAERRQPYLTATTPAAPTSPASTGEVQGEKPAESGVKKLHSQERLYGRVLRRVRLPLTADCEKTMVHLKDGVLTVTLGKKEPAAEKKRKLAILTE